MPVVRHSFQMFTFTRLLSVMDEYPSKKGEVNINVTIHNPPEIVEFKEEEVLFMKSTTNVSLKNIADVTIRGETLYKFESGDEKDNCVAHIREHNKLPADLAREIMNQIGARVMLSIVKAHTEFGIPPPVPLPRFEKVE